MCKSLYYTVVVSSTLSDSNPVPRRFRSIDSYLFDIVLSLLLSQQPTNQPLKITKTRHPPFLPKKKTLAARVEKKGKKRRIKLVSYIYIHIYINPRKEME